MKKLKSEEFDKCDFYYIENDTITVYILSVYVTILRPFVFEGAINSYSIVSQ